MRQRVKIFIDPVVVRKRLTHRLLMGLGGEGRSHMKLRAECLGSGLVGGCDGRESVTTGW